MQSQFRWHSISPMLMFYPPIRYLGTKICPVGFFNCQFRRVVMPISMHLGLRLESKYQWQATCSVGPLWQSHIWIYRWYGPGNRGVVSVSSMVDLNHMTTPMLTYSVDFIYEIYPQSKTYQPTQGRPPWFSSFPSIVIWYSPEDDRLVFSLGWDSGLNHLMRFSVDIYLEKFLYTSRQQHL